MSQSTSIPFAVSKKAAALKIARMGFIVIPVPAGEKRPVCKWNIWEKDQSEAHIEEHWAKYPDHDIGIITRGLYVLDADSPEAVAALYDLEEQHKISPKMIIGTNKGEHHYFTLPDGVIAKSKGFKTSCSPEKIDIRTGRSVIIAPGSTNKRVLK